nr:uncharacterized protein c1a6.01c [Quercus suber]
MSEKQLCGLRQDVMKCSTPPCRHFLVMFLGRYRASQESNIGTIINTGRDPIDQTSILPMAQQLEQWALSRLQQLLPLDDDSLRQVIEYARTLSKDAAAEHLSNILGQEPRVVEFISGFNLRRPDTSTIVEPSQSIENQERQQIRRSEYQGSNVRSGRGGKKRANIHALPARQVEGRGDVAGTVYRKHDEQDYMPQSSRPRASHKEHVAKSLALTRKEPDAQTSLITDAMPTNKHITSKVPPSAAGTLISDTLASRKSGSAQSSRSSSSAPGAKVNISGGMAMHGASTTLSDLDSAIRSLEVQTNPTLSAASGPDNKKRQCNCMATRHPLLDIAPNCLNCGKVICIKQGLGPCTFCGTALLATDEIDKVLRVLKDERGEERQKVNNAANKRADVAHGKARAFTGRDFLAQTSNSARSSPLSSATDTPAGSDDEAAGKAKAHRDKLLTFQANNARRTQVHDEAADYEVPVSGTNMWASPSERAQQLKRQQKMLREIEWNARPDYEKRRVVASIDLKGGKIVRRMAEVEKPDFTAVNEVDDIDYKPSPVETGPGQGAFGRNPLAAGLVRPKARENVDRGRGQETRDEKSTWRRVQMEEDDNEGWILDGGVYGGRAPNDRLLGAEEHAFG